MSDLATLTKATFDAQLGTRCVMRVSAEQTLELEVVRTEALPTAPNAKRGAFLVQFRAATKDHLPQRMYTIEHPALGTLELFVVPSGADAVGMRYDAVFS